MSVEINEKMLLSCKNIVLEVKNNSSVNTGKYVRLLNNISVDFKSGELNAIMGSSGGGKTTFIDTLIGRIDPSSNSSGTIELSNNERNIHDWMKKIAYLEQDDYIVPNQTVKEFISFATNCRRSDRSYKDNNRIVDDLINKLGLAHRSNVMLDNVSGGERKRVMIAVEFAAETDIIILDEPTTGLDSHKAIEITEMLKKYAVEKNKIVIITIHQPGSGLFEVFDKLLFISAGMKVYDGKATDISQYLLEKGLKQPESLSKPEFLFELFSGGYSIFPEIQQGQGIVEKILTDAKDEAIKSEKNVVFNGSSYPYINFDLSLKQAIEIFSRRFKLDLRNYALFKKLLFFNLIFISVNLLFTPFIRFYKSLSAEFGNEKEVTLRNMFKVSMDKFGVSYTNIFAESIAIRMVFISVSIYPFFSGSIYSEREIISRELRNNLYTVSSLLLSNLFYSINNGICFSVPILIFCFIFNVNMHKMYLTTTMMLLGFISADTGMSFFTLVATSTFTDRIYTILWTVVAFISTPYLNQLLGDFLWYFYSDSMWFYIFLFFRYLTLACSTYFSNLYMLHSFFIKNRIFQETSLMYHRFKEARLLYFIGLVEKWSTYTYVNPFFYTYFSHADSKYFVLAMCGLVSTAYIFLQLWFIIYRHAPRIRVKL